MWALQPASDLILNVVQMMSVWNSGRFWRVVEVTAVKTAGRDDIVFLYCPKAENIQVLCGGIPGGGLSKLLFTFDREPVTAKVRMFPRSWWTRVLLELHAGAWGRGISDKSRSDSEIAASQEAHPGMGEPLEHFLFQAAQLRSVLTACISLEKEGPDESTQFQGFLKSFWVVYFLICKEHSCTEEYFTSL